MNRHDLQILSRERLRDARVLLSKERHVGAYYLAGYAVECALKACIARQTQRFDFPDKKVAVDSYTHNLVKLVGLAGLTRSLETTSSSDRAFGLNWTVVKDWDVEDRYNLSISLAQAKDIYSAISSRRGGVMTWIRGHW